MPASARAIGCALLMPAAAAAPARSQSLTLLIWEAYVSPKLIQRWKQRTHPDISQIYFDGGDRRGSMLSNLALIAPRWRDACGPYGAAHFRGMDGMLYRSD